MKVGLLIDRWDPQRGGAEACLDLLAKHLVGAGHEVHVIGATASGPLPGPFHRVHGRGLSRGVRELRLGRNMTAAAQGVGCDVTLAVRHVERPDVLWLHGGAHRVTVEARWRAAHRGRPLPRALALRGRHRAFAGFERTAMAGKDAGGAGCVVCPSPLVAEELERCHPSTPVPRIVVENGVDLDRFHPGLRNEARARLGELLDVSPDTQLIVTIARNPLLKGVPHLLRALGPVPGPWCLLLAGPKRVGSWRLRARRAGVPPDRLRVVPHLDPELLAAGAHLSVLPTWRDPCPLSTLEALAAGTPVVTTGLSGLADVVVRSGGEVVSDPAQELELGGAIARLLQDSPSPEAVRASVEGRGLRPWMETMEAALSESAERRG